MWVFLDPSSTRGWIFQGVDSEPEISIARWIGFSWDHTTGAREGSRLGQGGSLGVMWSQQDPQGTPQGVLKMGDPQSHPKVGGEAQTLFISLCWSVLWHGSLCEGNVIHARQLSSAEVNLPRRGFQLWAGCQWLRPPVLPYWVGIWAAPAPTTQVLNKYLSSKQNTGGAWREEWQWQLPSTELGQPVCTCCLVGSFEIQQVLSSGPFYRCRHNGSERWPCPRWPS